MAGFTIPNEADAIEDPQAEFDSVDLSIMMMGNQFDGVITGCAASFVSGMVTRIAAGQVSVAGYYPFIAQIDLTHTAPVSGNRFDLITVNYNGQVVVTQGVASAVKPVFPAVPANSIPLAAVFVKSGDSALLAGRITDKRVVIQNIFEYGMEFLSFQNSNGNIGELGWSRSTVGTDSYGLAAPTTQHPGILFFGTNGAALANQTCIFQGSTPTSEVLVPASLSRVKAICRFSNIANAIFKFGLSQSATDKASGTWGTSGAWFEYDSAVNGNWRTFTRNSSVSSTNDTGVVNVLNNWFDFEMVRLQNGTFQFGINGNLVSTHTSNLPGAIQQLAAFVGNRATADRYFDIDYLGYNLVPLGARYT